MYSSVKQCAVVLGVLSLQCTFYTRRPGDNQTSNQTPPDSSSSAGNGGGSAVVGGLTGDPLPGDWLEVSGNLADVPSGFGNLTLASAKPDEDLIIAGLSEGGLWASKSGGLSWTQLGTGKGSSTFTNRPSAIVYDPVAPASFWFSGTYGDGVFRTTDDGETFQHLGTIDRIDLVSVAFDDPQRQILMASVHEQATVYRSTDGGSKWLDITENLGSDVNTCGWPLVIDSQTHLVACSQFGSGMGGIFKTIDGGDTWQRVSEVAGDLAPLLASDGTIYWSVQGDAGLLRSEDSGDTWTRLAISVIAAHPIELPDGRIATVDKQTVVTSADHGDNWKRASPVFPYQAVGVIYSSFQQAFFIWHLSADPMIPSDAISRFAVSDGG